MLERVAAQMDADQAQYLFPMWSNVNIPAVAMRLVAFRDDDDPLLVFQTIGVSWSGNAVLRMWNVYGTALELHPLDPDGLMSPIEMPAAVTLSPEQERRVERVIARSIPDARPEDRPLFIAIARGVEAKRDHWFVSDAEVRTRFGRPGMRKVARYRAWPELDLANEEMPSASRFFRKVLARVDAGMSPRSRRRP
jgi:hypothetical protein